MPQYFANWDVVAEDYVDAGGLSAALGHNVVGIVSGFVELAASGSSLDADALSRSLTLGLYIQPSDDWIIDLGCYFGLNEAVTSTNPFFGMSYRI